MHKKPVLTPSLVTWTGIFVLCFLIGAGGVRIAQHHAGSWQAMRDTIQADTPSTADRLATHEYFHETEKIPTQDDSLKVSLTFEVWHIDTVRISGLPTGALVRISYPDLHAFVIDTANDSGEIVYPHPANWVKMATEAFVDSGGIDPRYHEDIRGDPSFSSLKLPALEGKDVNWYSAQIIAGSGMEDVNFATKINNFPHVWTQHELDSAQTIWIKEFTKWLDTAHLYLKPDSKLLNN